MQLTERHIIKSTEFRFAQIDKLAFKSKKLKGLQGAIALFLQLSQN